MDRRKKTWISLFLFCAWFVFEHLDFLLDNSTVQYKGSGLLTRFWGKQLQLPMSKARKAVRSKVKIRAISPEERQRFCDARWAQHDAEVQVRHCGEFVVPLEGKIVAHGTDAAAVLAEAAQRTGRKPDDLPLVGIVDPMQDIPH
jgi:hypothetical protein